MAEFSTDLNALAGTPFDVPKPSKKRKSTAEADAADGGEASPRSKRLSAAEKDKRAKTPRACDSCGAFPVGVWWPRS
jgi:hypothetical protein